MIYSRGRIYLEHTKNGERRSLHITGHAYQLLDELLKIRRQAPTSFFQERLDGLAPLDIRKSWKSALKSTDILDFPNFMIYVIAVQVIWRCTGTTPTEIAEVLGHKSLSLLNDTPI